MFKTFFVVILSLHLCSASLAEHLERSELKIGVLAKRGPDVALAHWTEMANYLNKALPEQHFIILPLNFAQIENAVKNHQIDFLLTNSAMFVDLSLDYSLFPIATLKRKYNDIALTEFGSVIFTRSDRDKINQLSDLIGQDLAAVDQRSLGGWIAAYRELDSHGISLQQLHSVEFLGIHDAVVYAVKNQMVDVGIVRSDTLERMAQEGKIKLSRFKVIHPDASDISSIRNSKTFPLMNSTRLYPEWPITSLTHVPRQLAEQVSSALLLMKADDPAASKAQIMGWTVPRNYAEIDQAFSQLQLGYYAKDQALSLFEKLQNNWKDLAWFLSPLFLLIISIIYLFSQASKIKQLEKKRQHLLSHDGHTNLPNRQTFYELATTQIYNANHDQRSCLLLYLDLDDFRKINMEFGRDVGTQPSAKISENLTKQLQTNDLIARIEGDEFLILLANPNSVGNYRVLLQSIIEQVMLSAVIIQQRPIETSCSMGISRFPNQGIQLNDLIRSAEIGLDLAKKSGKSRYFISPD
ncbi:MAG: PhnD/SsuA/transferrin family substrate-binding protein [Enterobacterales bacterium]|nr:PhnD/SsuA/transferrin family substrate-binding protein [Enterobacterales bacterium]